MHLSGEVPVRIAAALADPALRRAILGDRAADAPTDWAVHAGGRSILDAVQTGFDLPSDALAVSRDILRRWGNMSSSTLMFVLAAMLAQNRPLDGLAVAFGPGLAAEGFALRSA